MVYQVLDLLAGGNAIGEITSDDYYPGISRQDVLACIAYATTRLGALSSTLC